MCKRLSIKDHQRYNLRIWSVLSRFLITNYINWSMIHVNCYLIQNLSSIKSVNSTTKQNKKYNVLCLNRLYSCWMKPKRFYNMQRGVEKTSIVILLYVSFIIYPVHIVIFGSCLNRQLISKVLNLLFQVSFLILIIKCYLYKVRFHQLISMKTLIKKLHLIK